MLIRHRSDAVAAGAVAVLLAAAAWELAVAAKVVHFGRAPGQGAPGEGIAVGFGLVALLAAMAISFVAILRGRQLKRAYALLPLAAAAFVTARYYSFDPYYAPARRRFSDGGLVAGSWMFALDAALVASAVLIAVRPRRWVGILPVLLLLCAGTVVVQGAGH